MPTCGQGFLRRSSARRMTTLTCNYADADHILIAALAEDDGPRWLSRGTRLRARTTQAFRKFCPCIGERLGSASVRSRANISQGPRAFKREKPAVEARRQNATGCKRLHRVGYKKTIGKTGLIEPHGNALRCLFPHMMGREELGQKRGEGGGGGKPARKREGTGIGEGERKEKSMAEERAQVWQKRIVCEKGNVSFSLLFVLFVQAGGRGERGGGGKEIDYRRGDTSF